MGVFDLIFCIIISYFTSFCLFKVFGMNKFYFKIVPSTTGIQLQAGFSRFMLENFIALVIVISSIAFSIYTGPMIVNLVK